MSILGFLGQAVTGALKGDGYLRDATHASKLYVDNNYGMAPKSGWSYYVQFNLNPAMNEGDKGPFKSLDPSWFNKNAGKVGLLAKTCDMPRFSIATETLNQYNRKTIVQSKITYQPITITLHDDNDNVSTNMWKNYYQYYFADSRYDQGSGGQKKGETKTSKSVPPQFQNVKYGPTAYPYGLNNQQTVPFFKSITIYLMNRKKFNSVTLINPIITEWQHSQLDNSQGTKTLDSRMTVAYETVFYDTGANLITKSNPGFNKQHYDSRPSPLSIFGGGSKTLLGAGGLMAGANEIFGRVTSDEPLGFADILQIGIGTKNLFENGKNLNKKSVASELMGVTSAVVAAAVVSGTDAVTDAYQRDRRQAEAFPGLSFVGRTFRREANEAPAPVEDRSTSIEQREPVRVYRDGVEVQPATERKGIGTGKGPNQ